MNNVDKYFRNEASHTYVNLKLHGDCTLIQLAKIRFTSRAMMEKVLEILENEGKVIRVGRYFRAVGLEAPVTPPAEPEFPSKREVKMSELDAVYEALAVHDLKDALTVIQDLKAELEQAQAFRREVARELGLDALSRPWTIFAAVRQTVSIARVAGNAVAGLPPAKK